MSKVNPSADGQKSKVGQSGFTLVELLVVIAIIAILFAVILVAINPAQRFKDSRNARRLQDVGSIAQSVVTYTADKKGTPPVDIPDGQCIGTKPATVVSDTSPVPRAHWTFEGDANDTLGGFNGATSESGYANPAKLNQGLTLQSPLYGVSIPGTVDDTLTNALTVEGWIKLNQKIEAGSFDHHQTLFDKGNYQLQLNSDSGKLEMRLENSETLNNEYTGGSIRGFNSFVQFQGTLYAGALKENSPSPDTGVVLKKGTSSWGEDTSFPSGSAEVHALTIYNGKLYSGQSSTDTKPRVYAFDGTSWKNTNLENVITGTNLDVLSLVRYKGKLIAGLGTSVVGNTYIAEFDGANWRILRQFDGGTEAYAVNAFAVFNGKLYAGTGRGPNGEGRVYEFNGTSWTLKFGPPGQLGNKDAAHSLIEYDKQLFIGMGGGGANDGVVYQWDGAAVNPTATTVVGSFPPRTLSLGVVDGSLFGGWSGSSNGAAQIHKWTPPNWALYGSIGGAEVKSFYPYNDALYVGSKSSDPTTIAEIRKQSASRFVESKKSTWYPNAWYHVAGTYDGTNGNMTLLINGAIDATTSTAIGLIANNSQPLYLGIGYNADALSGVIDDFAVHHSALTDTIIASHAGCYNLGQYVVPEYMGTIPTDPSSTVTDGTDTGYMITRNPIGGVTTISAPLTEIGGNTSAILQASR